MSGTNTAATVGESMKAVVNTRYGSPPAATHTGALAGVDAVYAAAFRRARLLRVFDLDELFAAAESGRLSPFEGKRLAILTNGGGIGVLAVDRVVDLGGTLAGLSPQTLAKLDSILPPTWSKSNPVDIIEDADATRYAAALQTLIDDPENDAVLAMNVPTALASAGESPRSPSQPRPPWGMRRIPTLATSLKTKMQFSRSIRRSSRACAIRLRKFWHHSHPARSALFGCGSASE